ncbi:methylcrotonoyl-CoA carboxylase subunit alpha, mitochondrial isoform X1 [Cephus cinctus]|uniref:Methylcrotonoyl-CoA carboxylase subunit alpha, mitochondrial isoform X1 n=2 Tax=Cephus cinctus TaxID=211228 RepID=A0AAJ7FE66_CEPCN|nr:methylcrotonoyl-CoA carboxylase subunit alpha, mitochondrial isoform X1 [Cephus cinctus]
MHRFGRLKSLFECYSSYLTACPDCQFSSSTGQNRRIDKVLIANRGEIACRISRTARKLGVKTVAVYSDADRDSMHVDLADEAYCIGPAASSQSYLRQDKIIATAKKSHCQAVHPGYGFLSENTEFAELCQKENIIFIGPPASAIRDMGIKSTSKAIMAKAGVPIIEGYHEEDQSDITLLAEAKKIGFPLMIKAVRGGGGKGMRIALKESDFTEALESARTESQKAFGDSAVLLEKFVAEPRHVEVQVFADHYGNAVHLFERDCSVQRRHQKVIEEAPAPGISAELRAELGAAAVRAAKAVGYVGAGTVEFIMDRNTHSFHFMEMNTRLQVEHPVTEAITGTDLVEWQLKVAAGEKLPLTQEEIQLKGHAFEARIYAEDPRGGFLPGAGPLLYLRTPETSENVRVETGVRQGDEVSVHYDPMIAKLVVWGKNREEALSILRGKLSEYDIVGVETNVEFIKDLSAHPKFQNGEVHTGFIEENFDSLFRKLQVPKLVLAQGALALILLQEYKSLKAAITTQIPFNPFTTEVGLRLNHILNRRFKFNVLDNDVVVDVKYTEPEVYSIRVDNLGPWRKVTGILINSDKGFEINSEIDGIKSKVRIVKLKDELYIFTNDRKWQLKIAQAKFISLLSKEKNVSAGAAISPMPGVVDKVLIKKGDVVSKGDPLIVIVAMKMEHIIKASADGTIDEVLCAVGDNVAKNKLLVQLKESP